METTPVRVARLTHRKLRELSEQSGEPLAAVVARAVEALRRELFFDRMDDSFGEILADDEERAALAAERSAWEATLGDGLGLE